MRIKRVKETKRPYRLRVAKKNRDARWRCYKYSHNGHDGAVKEMRIAPIGGVIELYNIQTGRLLMTYRKPLKGRIEWE